MFAFHTVAQGQRVAVWDKQGHRTVVEGPRRLALLGGRWVEPMEAFVAGPAQYLVVQHRDGRIEHRRGPAVFWMDRVEHLKVSVADAIPLDANEALVVYRQNADAGAVAEGETATVDRADLAGNVEAQPAPNPAAAVPAPKPAGRVDRRIVRGPALFVPGAQEWLHEFRWHGADPRDPRKKTPRGLTFSKLRVIPDQTYFDVESVRTADDALLIVRLMIFFELIDIEAMLDQTHDVVGDMVNAVTADVIDFAARLTFEQFKERTDQLNARETYPQLGQRLGRIGYRLNKVVYRGYEATPKLQAMHDNAIEARTRLKLDAETEAQAQALADLKLTREQDRARQRQAMAQAEAEHQAQVQQVGFEQQLRQKQSEQQQAMAQRQADAEQQLRQRQLEQEQQLKHKQAEQDLLLKRARAEREQALCAERETGELKLAQQRAADEQRAAFLKAIGALEVDLTRYLVARHERPDRRIRLDGDRRAQLHLHEG